MPLRQLTPRTGSGTAASVVGRGAGGEGFLGWLLGTGHQQLSELGELGAVRPMALTLLTRSVSEGDGKRDFPLFCISG